MKLGKAVIVALVLMAVVITGLAPMLVLAQGGATATTTFRIEDLVSTAVKNPKVLVAIVIQLALGIALGYVSVKVIKYILAFIGILVLGAVLSVWSLGGSVQDFITKLGMQAQQVMPFLKSLLATLGLLTVGPVSIGFIIGILIGIAKK